MWHVWRDFVSKGTGSFARLRGGLGKRLLDLGSKGGEGVAATDNAVTLPEGGVKNSVKLRLFLAGVSTLAASCIPFAVAEHILEKENLLTPQKSQVTTDENDAEPLEKKGMLVTSFQSVKNMFNPAAPDALAMSVEDFISFSPERRISTILNIIHLAIFGLWQVRALHPLMRRHMALNLDNLYEKRLHTLITCNFSHQRFLHLFFNSWVLTSFSAAALVERYRRKARTYGATQAYKEANKDWLFNYLGGGLASSTTSALYLRATNNFVTSSVGASGCLLSLIASFAVFRPDAQFGLIFVPGFTFSAENGVYAMFLFDTLGLLFGRRLGSFFDHAGHLGGLGFGYLTTEDLGRKLRRLGF